MVSYSMPAGAERWNVFRSVPNRSVCIDFVVGPSLFGNVGKTPEGGFWGGLRDRWNRLNWRTGGWPGARRGGGRWEPVRGWCQAWRDSSTDVRESQWG